MNLLAAGPMWGGAVAMAKGAWHMWEGEGSTSWTRAQGTVRCTRVVAEEPEVRDPHFWGVVEYEYKVGETVYVSERWSYGDDNQFDDELETQNFLSQYKAGMPIDAFYDPRDPARAVLIQGQGNDGMMAAVTGAVVFLFGLYNALT